jgi:hypothetical protein
MMPRTENPGVGGSIPPLPTIFQLLSERLRCSVSRLSALSVQYDQFQSEAQAEVGFQASFAGRQIAAQSPDGGFATAR